VTTNPAPLPMAGNLAHAVAGHLAFLAEALPSGAPSGTADVIVSNHPQVGFTRDFATADGERVMVTALTQQQFADLVRTTRLGRIFAFLERLLPADFSATDDLYAYRETIAALLAPWFARRTVTDLTAAFAGTTVTWARLHNLSGRPGSRR
jgi:2-methylfumaryl-CoA isomerase